MLQKLQTILIVEDDPLIREDMAYSVRDHGYAVLEAASADNAKVMLEGSHDIALICTDVRMPGR
jgi:CheY-like chemotaxis protein